MVVDLTDGTGLAEAKMPKKRSRPAKKEVGAYASALFDTLCSSICHSSTLNPFSSTCSLNSCLVIHSL